MLRTKRCASYVCELLKSNHLGYTHDKVLDGRLVLGLEEERILLFLGLGLRLGRGCRGGRTILDLTGAGLACCWRCHGGKAGVLRRSSVLGDGDSKDVGAKQTREGRTGLRTNVFTPLTPSDYRWRQSRKRAMSASEMQESMDVWLVASREEVQRQTQETVQRTSRHT